MCQFFDDIRDQTNHQGKRNYEVRLSSSENRHAYAIRREDDTKWPQKNKDGRQELEIRLGNEHISFEVCDCIVLDYVRLILELRLPKLAHLWT